MDLGLIVLLKEKLQCGTCKDVLVEINEPSLLAVNDGVIDPARLQTFVRAEIVSWTIVTNKFGCKYYQYDLKYDSAVLQDEDEQIGECNVLRVCCAECVFDYVDQRFIDEATVSSLLNNGDNSFTHDDGLGNLTTIQFGHTLEETAPGELTLTRPNATTDVVNVTNIVNLPITGTGILGDPLDVLISTDVGNSLVLGTDSGLYVTPAGGETVTTLVDNADNTFTYTSEDATVTVFDAAHTLAEIGTAELRMTRPDGTFDDVDLSVFVGLPIEGTGTSIDPLTILLSADVGNAISLGTDSGLFVDPAATVNVTLPITGDGSGGSPLDILLSADADNVIVLGTDSGLYVPDQVETPDSIILTRSPANSDNNGSGTTFNLRIQTMSAAGTSTSRYLIQVPADWDTAQDPLVRARLSNANAADGNIRYEWGLAYFAPGELLDSVDDETLGFTHVVATAAGVLYETVAQALTAASISPGDFVRVVFRRQGGDAADTQTGSSNLFEISIEFPRTGFGVTT